MSKPFLLLVHGGWSGAWVWDMLRPELKHCGMESMAVELPGCTDEKSFAWRYTLDDYVDEILHHGKDNRPVYLVAHSAGGIPASQAAEIAPEYFKKVIYLSAFLPVNGESLGSLNALNKNPTLKSSIKPNFLRGTLEQDTTNIAESSYHDCDSKWVAANVHRHRPEPIRPGGAKVQLGANFAAMDKAYIKCANDRGLVPEFQDLMIGRHKLESVMEISTGHMPMIAAPKELAELLAGLV